MPSSKTLKKNALAALRGHWIEAVVVCLVAGILGGRTAIDLFSVTVDISTDLFPGSGFTYWVSRTVGPLYGEGYASSAYSLLCLLLGCCLALGCSAFFCKLFRGSETGVGELFAHFKPYGSALWLRILTGIRVFLWSLLLVIPGIIAAYRYAMAPYLRAENPDLKAAEALEMSSYMMHGHKSELFFLQLSFIGWMLLSALTLGLGFIVLAPYMEAAQANFFLELLSRRSPYDAPQFAGR